jgi:hypothetical protein
MSSTENSAGRVSVIIPARDEEANIARAVRSVAAQEDVREILVIDDQSSDRTSEVLEVLKAEVSGLRVMRIEFLPPGWLGKTHAAATGARAADAAWLLFTDADTEHLPGSLRQLLRLAEQEDVDLLSVSPGQVTLTWWEKAAIPMIYAWLEKQFRFEEVNDPASPRAAANGQYILIRRDSYFRVGGHESLRNVVLEDVALAQRVKASGGRLLFLPGAQWVRTRMYLTFRGMWEGWTKNLYLLAGESTGALLAAIIEFCFLDVVPVAASIVLGAAAAVGSLSWTRAAPLIILGILVSLWRGARYRHTIIKLGFAPALANYRIPGAILVCLLLLNSAWTYCRGGKVKWKGRSYASVTRKVPEGRVG